MPRASPGAAAGREVWGLLLGKRQRSGLRANASSQIYPALCERFALKRLLFHVELLGWNIRLKIQFYLREEGKKGVGEKDGDAVSVWK